MLNWAIGIDMYTLMCIKLMPNKNLQYKKTNKKTNKQKKILVCQETEFFLEDFSFGLFNIMILGSL